MPTKLSGTKAPARSARAVTTPGASIQFSANVGTSDAADHVPALIIDARTIEDTAPKDLSLAPEQLSAITDLDSLKAAVTSALEANRDYLEATAIEGKNEALGTTGARKQAFFGAIREDLTRTALPAGDSPAAQRLLKGLEEATYMGHTIEFDTAKLDTYHPYRKPFDDGVRKLQALAPEGVERDNITHELDYITDRKTHLGWGPVAEQNAESTLLLRVIDRGNQGQAASLAGDSQNPLRPIYVVINVNPGGLPEGMEAHAGKPVIRDGEKYYFDKTDTPLPKELSAHLSEKSASSDLGLRTFETGEQPRASFPYDWNQNQSIGVDPINTGWWGHCHIEAPLASLSVSAGSEVTVFDTRSKTLQTFDDTDVNDLLFAMLDATNYADMDTSRGAYPNKTTFVGNRNDTSGSRYPGDKLVLEVDGAEHPFSLRLLGLFDPNNSDEKVDTRDTFSPTVITDGIQFKQNPAFQGLRNTDWSTIDGERKLLIGVEYMDVNESGTLKRQRHEVTIDPANPAEEPVLIGGSLDHGSYPPNVTKYYLNEKANQLESKTFTPDKQEDGTYKMVATSEEPTLLGNVTGRVLSQELIKESIIQLHDHVLSAARRGVAFVTEKAPGNQVWNYSTGAMTQTLLEQDGDFTRYSVRLKTQGGAIKWEYILQCDASGTPIDAHAINAPADFVWRPERWVSAPLYRDDDGRLLYNASAHERGFLLDADGNTGPEGMSFFRYASDVIYASLNDPKKDTRYVVIDADGELYFYDDLEVYKTDVNEHGGDASGVKAATEDDSSEGLGLLAALERAINGSDSDEDQNGSNTSSGLVDDIIGAVADEVIGSVVNLVSSPSNILTSIADGIGNFFRGPRR